jgi:hypothetical protein
MASRYEALCQKLRNCASKGLLDILANKASGLVMCPLRSSEERCHANGVDLTTRVPQLSTQELRIATTINNVGLLML